MTTRYDWNEALEAARDGEMARVLNFGFSAICDHLAGIEALLEPKVARAAEDDPGLALSELHDAIVDYLAEFAYPTNGPAWERLRRASADAAVILKLDGRFGDPS